MRYERLQQELNRVESTDDWLTIDMSAFLLAHFQAAGYDVKSRYLTALPKLAEHLDSCLKDLTGKTTCKEIALIYALQYQSNQTIGEVASLLVDAYR